jgi:hypothetical protein
MASPTATAGGAPPTIAYLVVRAKRQPQVIRQLGGGAAAWVRRIEDLARCRCSTELRPLFVDFDSGRLVTADSPQPLQPGALAQGRAVVLLANTAFFLGHDPCLEGPTAAALAGRVVVLAGRHGEGAVAAAVPHGALGSAGFVEVVRHLAALWHERPDPAALRAAGAELVGTGWPARANSPTASALSHPEPRCGPFAPAALNTALAELMDAPATTGPVSTSSAALRTALLAQRERSAVPWVFNALVNHIEYRNGFPVLESFPPEVHLALTGACNIECGFCSYAHDKAYFEYVAAEQVRRLDFLCHAHTLRLSSGLGEPTLNPHLPAIVRDQAERHPQLVLNLFTNGLALQRKGLIDALVHNVTWINVSVNNAGRETFAEMCGRDLFDRLCANLRRLRDAKLARNTAFPVVHGSMVLTTRSVADLPRMPALARSLGIDRFTAFPFASLQTDCRYGAPETLSQCRELYDALYDETLREAEKHRVSLEIPPPSGGKRLAFGLEVRPLYDFANIAEHPNPAALLVDDLDYEPLPRPNCPQIWHTASIGARFRVHRGTASHFLYPCLGPLCTVDFSDRLGFGFPDAAGFRALWNHNVFYRLRLAQRLPNLSAVCDACRGCDTRDPGTFAGLEAHLEPWRPEPVLVEAPQLIGRISR